MSQTEILNFLRENPDDFFTSREIADRIKNNRGVVIKHMKALRKKRSVIVQGGRAYSYQIRGE